MPFSLSFTLNFCISSTVWKQITPVVNPTRPRKHARLSASLNVSVTAGTKSPRLPFGINVGRVPCRQEVIPTRLTRRSTRVFLGIIILESVSPVGEGSGRARGEEWLEEDGWSGDAYDVGDGTVHVRIIWTLGQVDSGERSLERAWVWLS